MKLAEALQERADLNRKIAQLKSRLLNNVLVQEGEKTVEDPYFLKQELDSSIERLHYLITRINLTNCNTTINRTTLTELIAKKDALTLKISAYKDIVYTFQAQQNDVEVGEIVVIEYTGLLDKSTEVQKGMIIGIVPISNDEDYIIQSRSGGIFDQFETLANNKLKTMTLDEKIGQLLLVRYPGSNASEAL